MSQYEPSEETIQQVIEFAGLDPHDDRALAIQAIRSNGGNTEQVVMAYFEDPMSFRQKYSNVWDESAFGADRDGNNNSAGISFHIESSTQHDGLMAGTTGPDANVFGAPSRPPSRSSQRSVSMAVEPWAHTGPTANGVRTATQEDEDMERALRESAQEAGISQEQETGVTGSQITMSQPQFGPATRPTYDVQEWAMVQTGGGSDSNSNRIPQPLLRQRRKDAPAFLIQGPQYAGVTRMAALITILHSIPLARNKLLESGQTAASYSHNQDWWKGQDILRPEVLVRLQAGEIDKTSGEAYPNYEEEIHRLIAFLDGTTRSYGSVDSLIRIIGGPEVAGGMETWVSDSVEKNFYETFSERNPDQARTFFSKVTLEKVHETEDPAEVDDDSEGDIDAAFALLETEISKDDTKHATTLYEMMDHIMWSHTLSEGFGNDSKMAMFKELGDVFCIKIGGDTAQKLPLIPEKLYTERWSVDRKADACKIQAEWVRTKTGLRKVEEAQSNLESFEDPETGERRSKQEYLTKQLAHWQTYATFLEQRARFRSLEESSFDVDKYPDYKSAPSKMTEEDEKLYNECLRKVKEAETSLKALEKSKTNIKAHVEYLEAQQRYLGQILTDPAKDHLREKPMTRKPYLLRGIATSSNAMYVCKRAPEDLIELDDNPTPRDQWWQLSFAAKDDEPVCAEQLSFEEVHKRTEWEKKMPLLVYATENAMDQLPVPLPPTLERFVKADNKAFQREVDAAPSGESGVTAAALRSIEPVSPSKRKHRADSVDSMDSNRASVSSGCRNFDDPVPFENEQVIEGVEIMQSIEHSQHSHESVVSSNTMDLDESQDNRSRFHDRNTPEQMDGIIESGKPVVIPQTQPADQTQHPEMEQKTAIPPFMAAKASKPGTSDALDMDMPEE